MNRVEKLAVRAMLALVALLFPGSADAAFPAGDVAVSMTTVETIDPFPGGVHVLASDGSIQGSPVFPASWFRPKAVGFDLSRRLLISGRVSGPLQTDVYESLVTRTGTLPFGGSAFAFDAAGNGYVADEFTGLNMFSPSGAQLASFTLAQRAALAIDLAADQCTMFYAHLHGPGGNGTPGIGRHDVCRNVALADVPVNLPRLISFLSDPVALRILQDGTLIVTYGARAVRFDASGTILREYSIPGVVDRQWVALALDTTGSQFWLGLGRGFSQSTYPLYRIDLASGLVVAGPFDFPQFGYISSIAVAGEWRSAVAGAAAIPAVSTVTLLFLGCFLAALGAWRLT